MSFVSRSSRFLLAAGLITVSTSLLRAQQNEPQKPDNSILSMIQHFSEDAPGAWTADQLTTMGRIRDAALTDPYAYNELDHLANNIGPRLVGSAQAQGAVDWVAEELRTLGAKVTLEKTMVPHWVRGEELASLTSWPGGVPGTQQKLVVTALGGSPPTPKEGLTGEVVVLNSFAELKVLRPGSLKGKILVFNRPFDKELAAAGQGIAAYEQSVLYRALGPTAGGAAGAAAVLVRSVGSADFRLPHTGETLYAKNVVQVPSAALAAEDADLIATLVKQGPLTLHLALTTQILPDVPSYNVIADWPGTEHPEQIVMVSGHLDSWDLGTGAIDDGTGIVMSMQTIHLLAKLGIHPRRTVRFVAWMGEESGAQGAFTYAHDHESEIGSHVAVLEEDFGADHPIGLTFSGVAALRGYLAPLAKVLDPIGASMITPGDEIGEDVAPLISKGVPGFTAARDPRFYFQYHHTAADTFDKVDPKNLAASAAVMAVTAYALADAETPAPR
ncbi:M20/M25/M40 family metallo-hydrolase [Granulicella mallensis]|uniref:Carboxypeptidase Q n=1 Tax=Granulicella mallensis TaxID=940614 RepID=A0A7W7ZS63_9BACT|nr:M20/M25/M40 family metallo-hydrolase [Granulicella mallensis]MBB5065154.1 Zn-dependent M28 family amino/carboxypeptidase [Granulicella mallensis]